MKALARLTGVVVTAALAIGCSSSSDGTGDATFTAWGEEFIEQGIPSAEFADGWAVTFERFLIVLGNVRVADSSGNEGALLEGTQLFDLVTPGPHEVGSASGLDARVWDSVGYDVPLVDASTTLHASATADDRAVVEAGPYSVFASGTLTNGARTLRFDWGFDTDTRYASCVAEVDGKETLGFVVTRGGRESVELTIHGDHLFFDDLTSSDAMLRGEPVAAADADGDDVVTLDELRQVALVDIPEGTYGTGAFADVNDLGAFVRAQTRTLGHFRGEGHCTPRLE